MEIIAEATSHGRIKLVKELYRERAKCNYHFFPEWYLTQLFQMTDVTTQLKTIMAQNWGTWGPKSKDDILGQSFTCVIKDVVHYDIVLTKNIDACRIVYLKVATKIGYKWETKLYIATNGYYSAVSDENDDLNYDVINSIFKSDEVGSEWQQSLPDVYKNSNTPKGE